ncbi:Gfo/Idh/MocA family protein [Planctomicrobium sp. SH664]|uniref:Gfo/Idh/MocA family protein n=1 Tax=Planctomicrobium sp. SH664 TaxID=3448125 RepID=UPI003F5B383A
MPTTNSARTNSASPATPSSTRRDFLKTGAAASVTGTLLANFDGVAKAFADGNETIRVGLVGCGGRGSGAAYQALMADPYAKLVAVGDAYPEPIASCLKTLGASKKVEGRVTVDPEQQHSGLDAYKKVIDACDVVLLASPPGFRPEHLAYAVEKGKHIFCEKPMATDAPGLRSVMESVKVAKAKKLALVAGFCWRYDLPRREFFKRVLDGAAGDVVAAYGTYLTSPVKPMPAADTRPAGITDVDWMVRNWYNFCWLSGDGLVEQAVHTVDWLAWAKGDQTPVSCVGIGGRQIPAKGGDIYDHVEVNYLWGDGTRSFIAQRQIAGCAGDNSLYLFGTKGQGTIGGREITLAGETISSGGRKGSNPNMYQVEHDELFESIRSGNPINDGDRMCNSTLMGLMGRMSAYTGKVITAEMALNSEEKLVPDNLTWETPVTFRSPPLPGLTPFI